MCVLEMICEFKSNQLYFDQQCPNSQQFAFSKLEKMRYLNKRG